MYAEDKSFDRKPMMLKTGLNLNLADMKPKRPVSEMVDSNLLKLSSPDLERLLLSNGLVTTPTPTQFFYPKDVTEEQEAYARGFLEALGQLHKSQDESTTMADVSFSQPQHSTVDSMATMKQYAVDSKPMVSIPQQYMFSTNGSLPGTLSTNNLPTVVGSINRTATPPQNYINIGQRSMVMRLKEEPQLVPSMSPSPSVQPINMEEQELIKIDRKRARNRIAARKCRQRKLDHISTLEDRVRDLKGDRDRLQNSAKTLREQVEQLQQQVMRHRHNGCNILLS